MAMPLMLGHLSNWILAIRDWIIISELSWMTASVSLGLIDKFLFSCDDDMLPEVASLKASLNVVLLHLLRIQVIMTDHFSLTDSRHRMYTM